MEYSLQITENSIPAKTGVYEAYPAENEKVIALCVNKGLSLLSRELQQKKQNITFVIYILSKITRENGEPLTNVVGLITAACAFIRFYSQT